MTSTHDLPTVAGWWHGSDIATRAACGRLGVGVNEADVAAERAGDRNALVAGFRAGRSRATAIRRRRTTRNRWWTRRCAFVAATPSPLCLPPIEDLLGVEEQPNLPGTIDQHPNWRRRLTTEAGALLDEPRTAARVAQLAAKRPRL